ncbi:MAG: DUF1735 domain-containing protein [Ginsengibacter sp.]
MKRITVNYFCFLIAGLAFVLINGCNKKDSLPIPEFPDFYGSISIPQAANSPVNASLLIGGGDTSFQFQVLAVGDHSEGHDRDINVTIQAMPQLVDSFNAKNNTNYTIMPQGSYELDSGNAVIKAQKSQSNNVTLKLSPKNITGGNTYLLPVGITAMDNPAFVINSMSKTLFFIVKVSDHSAKMVLQLENIGDNPFSCFKMGNNLITFSYGTGDGVMRKYSYDSSAVKFSPGAVITNTFISSYNYASFSAFIPISSSYIIIRYSGDGLYGLDANNIDNNSVSFTNSISAFAFGYTGYDRMIPYKGSILGLTLASNGLLDNHIVDTATAGVLSVSGQGPDLGSGWGIYSQIIPYTDGLLCVTSSGDLYYYPVSTDFKVSPAKKVGTGWNKYKKIVPFGNDLLGIDANNVVYRYSFNINEEWDIK